MINIYNRIHDFILNFSEKFLKSIRNNSEQVSNMMNNVEAQDLAPKGKFNKLLNKIRKNHEGTEVSDEQKEIDYNNEQINSLEN